MADSGEIKRWKLWHRKLIEALGGDVVERSATLTLANDLKERVRELEDKNRGITCVYCGYYYGPVKLGVQDKMLTEHIEQCEKHPVFALKKRVKMLEDREQMTCEVIAESTKPKLELRQVRIEIAKLRERHRTLAHLAVSVDGTPDKQSLEDVARFAQTCINELALHKVGQLSEKATEITERIKAAGKYGCDGCYRAIQEVAPLVEELAGLREWRDAFGKGAIALSELATETMEGRKQIVDLKDEVQKLKREAEAWTGINDFRTKAGQPGEKAVERRKQIVDLTEEVQKLKREAVARIGKNYEIACKQLGTPSAASVQGIALLGIVPLVEELVGLRTKLAALGPLLDAVDIILEVDRATPVRKQLLAKRLQEFKEAGADVKAESHG